jgi:hypothetical protein
MQNFAEKYEISAVREEKPLTMEKVSPSSDTGLSSSSARVNGRAPTLSASDEDSSVTISDPSPFA